MVWQRKKEQTSAVVCTFNANLSTQFVDNALYDRQTKAMWQSPNLVECAGFSYVGVQSQPG
jgi:hypothetical protein